MHYTFYQDNLMHTELVPAVLYPPVPVGPPRSVGVHVSSVIRCIATENGILKPEWADELSLVDMSQEKWWGRLGSGNQLRIALGLAWEQWYIPQLREVVDHPGEMQLEGIYMTHDGESIDYINSMMKLCLHEVKLTYKSTKTVGDLLTQWMWLAQTKAYCKALGTLTAYLHVLFACGDYKYPITPQLKVWCITYTQEELDDNWDLILGYVQHQRQLEMEDEGMEGA